MSHLCISYVNICSEDVIHKFVRKMMALLFLPAQHIQSMFVRIREREMFYLTTHSTHFIYGYMASDIWLRTILIVRKETRCRHIGYSYRLAARVLLYAPSHRQDSTYHGLCYTSRGALAGTRNSFVRIKSLMPTNWKMCEVINYVCQPWIEHPVFVPHC